MSIFGRLPHRHAPVHITGELLTFQDALAAELEAEDEQRLRARFKPESPDAEPQFFTMDGILFNNMLQAINAGEVGTEAPLAN